MSNGEAQSCNDATPQRTNFLIIIRKKKTSLVSHFGIINFVVQLVQRHVSTNVAQKMGTKVKYKLGTQVGGRVDTREFVLIDLSNGYTILLFLRIQTR